VVKIEVILFVYKLIESILTCWLANESLIGAMTGVALENICVSLPWYLQRTSDG
jgi:hypothetical protein